MDLQIQGTPTIRIFHPGTEANRLNSAFYGFNVPVKTDRNYYLNTIIYNFEIAEQNGKPVPVSLKPLK